MRGRHLVLNILLYHRGQCSTVNNTIPYCVQEWPTRGEQRASEMLLLANGLAANYKASKHYITRLHLFCEPLWRLCEQLCIRSDVGGVWRFVIFSGSLSRPVTLVLLT